MAGRPNLGVANIVIFAKNSPQKLNHEISDHRLSLAHFLRLQED